MRAVGAKGIVCVLLGASSLAYGDVAVGTSLTGTRPMEQMWPAVPAYHGLSLDDKMMDHFSNLTNVYIFDQLDTLSHDLIGLKVDGRMGRAKLRVGGGNKRYLEFRVASDMHFDDKTNRTRVQTRIQLGLAGHELDLKLPDMDVWADSYHGEQMVEVNVPLLERRF